MKTLYTRSRADQTAGDRWFDRELTRAMHEDAAREARHCPEWVLMRDGLMLMYPEKSGGTCYWGATGRPVVYPSLVAANKGAQMQGGTAAMVTR